MVSHACPCMYAHMIIDQVMKTEITKRMSEAKSFKSVADLKCVNGKKYNEYLLKFYDALNTFNGKDDGSLLSQMDSILNSV